jgi:hypothetical protein
MNLVWQDYSGQIIYYGLILFKAVFVATILYYLIKLYDRLPHILAAHLIKRMHKKLEEDPDYLKKLKKRKK